MTVYESPVVGGLATDRKPNRFEAWLNGIGEWIKKNWRSVIARAPIPMLSIGASFGVYEFSLLYFPAPIAGVVAGAYELVYIGLALLGDDLDKESRELAEKVSKGAVFVSVLYVFLAGLFYRHPEWRSPDPNTGDPTADIVVKIILEVVLGLVHAVPLPVIGYFVSRLVWHNKKVVPTTAQTATAQATVAPATAPMLEAPTQPALPAQEEQPADPPAAHDAPPVEEQPRDDAPPAHEDAHPAQNDVEPAPLPAHSDEPPTNLREAVDMLMQRKIITTADMGALQQAYSTMKEKELLDAATLALWVAGGQNWTQIGERTGVHRSTVQRRWDRYVEKIPPLSRLKVAA